MTPQPGAVVPHSRPWVTEAAQQTIAQRLQASQLMDAQSARQFCEALCAALSVPQVHLAPSGRRALVWALQALDVPAGGVVAVQSYVCPAVIEAITVAGFTPWLVDIGPHWQMSGETLRRAGPPELSAIVLCPPFGLAPDLSEFEAWTCPKIIDACQMGPGGVAAMARIGAEGLVLSFDPTKYIAAFGGALVPLTQDFAARVQVDKFDPYPSLYAALGLEQLAQLTRIEARKRDLARAFAARSPAAFAPALQACGERPEHMMRLPAWLSVPKAAEVIAQFNAIGIAARHGVDTLMHRELGLPDARFPKSCRAFAHTVSLPFHPSLNAGEKAQVVQALDLLGEAINGD